MHTHSCKLWHTSSGLVDQMMKGTLLPQAGEKLSAVTPHRWAIPTRACFPSLFKNKHLYTICHVSAHTQVSLSNQAFIPSSSTDEVPPANQHAEDPIPSDKTVTSGRQQCAMKIHISSCTISEYQCYFRQLASAVPSSSSASQWVSSSGADQ